MDLYLQPLESTPNCGRCGTGFLILSRKRNCHYCGMVGCTTCVDKKRQVLSTEQRGAVYVCEDCVRLIDMRHMDVEALGRLPLKELKAYVQAYGMRPAVPGVVEKTDLAKLIFSSEITPERELHRLRQLPGRPDVQNVPFRHRSVAEEQQQQQREQEAQRQRRQERERQERYRREQELREQQFREQQRRDELLQEQARQERERRDQQRRERQQREQQLRQEMQQQQREEHDGTEDDMFGLRGFNDMFQDIFGHQRPSPFTQPSRPPQPRQPPPQQQQQQRQPPPPQQRQPPQQQQQQRPPPQQQQRQQPQQRQQQSPPQSSPPSGSAVVVPPIESLARDPSRVSALSNKELKAFLTYHHVALVNVVERSELLELVLRVVNDHNAEQERQKAENLADPGAADDANMCKICFEHEVNCVFLECGHMMACLDCGRQLEECPVCRSYIIRVVRTFR